MPKLTRDQKKALKFQRSRIRGKITRKKIAKNVKEKVKQLSEQAKIQYVEIKNQANDNLKLAYESGIPIYLDLEYDVLMNEREIKSLALQISHIQGINKELLYPIQLHLTNVNGTQKNELEKQGLLKWNSIRWTQEGLQELIDQQDQIQQKEFIYLSPDAEQYLDSVQPDKCIYIVGGFVDRQVQKYMSFNKANTLQLACCKLPIDQYIKGNKRPLNVDRVVTILSLWYQYKDWKKAYEESEKFNLSLAERLLRE